MAATGRTRRQHRIRRLFVEALEDRRLLAPYGATSLDTGEYLLGDVLVNVVLFESDGSIDADTEDWRPDTIAAVKDKIQTGVNWWTDTLRNLPSWWYEGNPNPPEIKHSLNFQFDFTHADSPYETGYELISRRSQDHVFPVRDFLRDQGFWSDNQGFEENVRHYNHALREAAGTDWAFSIFIVNDENDIDHKFDVNGQFLQAFSFPGGQYIVSLASRPDSTIAHELGHQFWARDEYLGGGSYTDHRGYYDAQNTNAADNPNLTEREPSIMGRGTILSTAYAQHISSRSSLEMLGWRDSDADGIFDVLDVPLTLTGTGRYDANSGNFLFTGSAAVHALPNLNPAGTRNDITINEITRLEYRLDGGAWMPLQDIGAPTADIDLQIPLTGNEQSIEIRAVATNTDAFHNEWLIAESEPRFFGDLERTSIVGLPGINGFVWHDVDASQAWEQGEQGLAGWTIQVVDANGSPLNLQTIAEPDQLTDGQDVNDEVPGMHFSAVGSGVQSGSVRVAAFGSSSTGTKTFIHQRLGSIWSADWNNFSRRFRVDFDQPVTQVSLDAVAGTTSAVGRLDAYDAQGRILTRYTTSPIAPGEFETMTVSRGQGDIAYVIAGSHGDTFVRLDRLVVGPESSATTNLIGAYQLPFLPADTYRVQATPPQGWETTSPSTGQHMVTLAAGDAISHIDFGGRSIAAGRPWQNPNNAFDVSGEGLVTPRDVLLIIEDLDENGARELPDPGPGASPPPYVDVNGDNLLSPVDALLVLTFLNGSGSNGSGGNGSGGSTGGGPEGEFVENTRVFQSVDVPSAPGSAPADVALMARALSAFQVEFSEGLRQTLGRRGGIADPIFVAPDLYSLSISSPPTGAPADSIWLDRPDDAPVNPAKETTRDPAAPKEPAADATTSDSDHQERRSENRDHLPRDAKTWANPTWLEWLSEDLSELIDLLARDHEMVEQSATDSDESGISNNGAESPADDSGDGGAAAESSTGSVSAAANKR